MNHSRDKIIADQNILIKSLEEDNERLIKVAKAAHDYLAWHSYLSGEDLVSGSTDVYDDIFGYLQDEIRKSERETGKRYLWIVKLVKSIGYC